MNNKKLAEFTLLDIIERQIHFTKTNTIFDRKDFETYNEGSLLALNEMFVTAGDKIPNNAVLKFPIYQG